MTFITRLGWFFKQRWHSYAIAISIMIVVSLLSTVPPLLIGNTVDQIEIMQLSKEELLRVVLILIGLALFTYVLTYIWITTLYGNSVLIEKLLRGRLLGHLLGMKPSFFQRNSTGQLMALATNDVLAIGQTAGYGVMTLVHTVVGATVVVVMMTLFISYKLMLAALLPLPLLALVISKLGKLIRNRFHSAQEAFGRMNDHALESISGIRVVRSYVQEHKDLNAFDKVTTDVMDKNRRVAWLNALFHPVISIIVGISYAISIGYGSYLVFQEEIMIGQLITFNILLGMLIWPMISFGEFINVLQRGSASAERLDEAFEQRADVTEPAQPRVIAQHPDITLEALSFTYPGASTSALKSVSLSLRSGGTLGIVGKTGSGKSTLLKQLLRQYPIEPNRLLLSGVPIEELPLEELAAIIAYVPQEHLLLSRSIRDNIALGKPDATEADIAHAVEMASFTNDIAAMPEGLDTIVGENGVTLSGGQKQRLAIARALLVDSEILLMDDSLSAVDARTESRILHHIRRERAGKTTLITTHRLSAVSHADWIVVLSDGKVSEEGTHEQLMLHGGWYKEQWERQQMEAALES